MNCVTDGQPASAQTPSTNWRAAVALFRASPAEIDDGVSRSRRRVGIANEDREDLQLLVRFDRPLHAMAHEDTQPGLERHARLADGPGAPACEHVEDLVVGLLDPPRRSGPEPKRQHALSKLLAALDVIEERNNTDRVARHLLGIDTPPGHPVPHETNLQIR